MKFLVPEIPIGEKCFFVLLSKEKCVRARDKKRAILKKMKFRAHRNFHVFQIFGKFRIKLQAVKSAWIGWMPVEVLAVFNQ